MPEGRSRREGEREDLLRPVGRLEKGREAGVNKLNRERSARAGVLTASGSMGPIKAMASGRMTGPMWVDGGPAKDKTGVVRST